MLLWFCSPWAIAGLADSSESAEVNEAEQVEAVTEEPKDIGLIQQSGNVGGYMILPVGEDAVAATFLPEVLGEAYGKVLILHGEGGSYASDGLVNRLRFDLPSMGWSTMTVALAYPPAETKIFLSVTTREAEQSEEASADTLDLPAMPETDDSMTSESMPDNDDSMTSESMPAETAESVQEEAEVADPNQIRIATALAHLHAQHASGPTVIIAIGESADLANTVIAQIGHQRALIWVDPVMNSVSVPAAHRILDLVPGLDDSAVLAGKVRRVQMKQYNVKQYSQQVITAARSEFTGLEKDVFKRIHAWLYRHYVKREN
jgi:hypothetical protein